MNRFLSLITGTIGLALVSACSSLPIGAAEEERLVPSGANNRFIAYDSFAEYVRATREMLAEHRVFRNTEQAALEIDAVAPFELAPAPAQCKSETEEAILLVHGLSDSPFLMRDVARQFSERCYLVRAVLLPGHGTRPGDLMEVSVDDWESAVKHSLAQLQEEYEQVSVAGFSLGGALVLSAALEQPAVDAVYLFAPALAIRTDLIHAAPMLNNFVDWLDVDPPDDYARYEAFPTNAAAQLSKVIRRLDKRLEKVKKLPFPLFIAVSRDDSVISVAKAEGLIEYASAELCNRLVVFAEFERDNLEPGSTSTVKLNSYLPEQRIEMMSHQSIPLSPKNPYYGRDGSYRRCNLEQRPEKLEYCLNSPDIWYTAFSASGAKDRIYATLTFNPRYEEMWQALDAMRPSADPGSGCAKPRRP